MRFEFEGWMEVPEYGKVPPQMVTLEKRSRDLSTMFSSSWKNNMDLSFDSLEYKGPMYMRLGGKNRRDKKNLKGLSKGLHSKNGVIL